MACDVFVARVMSKQSVTCKVKQSELKFACLGLTFACGSLTTFAHFTCTSKANPNFATHVSLAVFVPSSLSYLEFLSRVYLGLTVFVGVDFVELTDLFL